MKETMKKGTKKKVIKHLKSDAKMFNKEAHEDKKLMKSIKDAYKDTHKKKTRRNKSKVEKVMHEYKEGTLHSGSKKGPKVKNRKQAIAIALSEARRAKKK